MGVNRPDVSFGKVPDVVPLPNPPQPRGGIRRFLRSADSSPGPDEPQYFADHRRRNPLYRKGFRCNYTFGTGTEKLSRGSSCAAYRPVHAVVG